MNNSGPLSFEAIIDDTNWQARLDAMERRTMRFADTTVRESSKIDSAFQNLGKLAAGAFAFKPLV